MSKPKHSIHCCGCNAKVEARLTDGTEIYPHRQDLADLPFWKCDRCGNHVGCHHKTSDRTRPLGCIPTPEIREARKHIHALVDPLWKLKKISRKSLYAEIKTRTGKVYHTAEIGTLEEARAIYRVVLGIKSDLESQTDKWPPRKANGGGLAADWKKKNDLRIFQKHGGDALIKPALSMLFGKNGMKSSASFAALDSLRKREKHLDQAVVRFLIGAGYVRVSSSKATSCELTKRGRKALGMDGRPQDEQSNSQSK